MMKKILSVLLAVMALFLAIAPAMAETHPLGLLEKAYTYNANGDYTSIRRSPNGPEITKLINGTKVDVVEYLSNSWAEIILKNGKTGYVQAKYLRDRKPSKYVTTEPESNFRDVKKAYIVVAKALNKKSDKSVGLRVRANKNSKAIRTLTAGEELEVLAVGEIWYKVLDPETGKTCYIAKDYAEFDRYIDAD